MISFVSQHLYASPPNSMNNSNTRNQLLSITFTGLMSYCFSHGIGRHMWDVPIIWLTNTLKLFTIAQYIYITLTGLIKLALLFFYYRIFPRHNRIRYFIIFGVLFVVVSHTTLLFCTVFACSPVQRSWDPTLPGRCWDPIILPYLSGALSVATDFYVLLLPVKTLWGLHTTTRKRIRLLIVFGLGGFACVASIVRLAMTRVLSDSTDATWNISRISRWATIEANTGIICACLPLLPALFDKYWSKDLGSSFGRLWSWASADSQSEVGVPLKEQRQRKREWQSVESKGQRHVAVHKLHTATMDPYHRKEDGQTSQRAGAWAPIF
ncbi:hypothetical protein BDV06DRAFT_228852 [Aspergillus oleicola]